MKKLLSDVVLVCGAVFALSVGALFAALTAQYIFKLEPCELCIYQRVPYCITALLSIAALIMTHNAEKVRVSAFLIFLCSFVFAIGSFIAFFHVGVEQHWWKSPLEGCSANLPEGLSGADLIKYLSTRKAVRCDEVAWADPIFHFSMATYNAMISLALAGLSFAASILITRRANGVLSMNASANSKGLKKPANSNER